MLLEYSLVELGQRSQEDYHSQDEFSFQLTSWGIYTQRGSGKTWSVAETTVLWFYLMPVKAKHWLGMRHG